MDIVYRWDEHKYAAVLEKHAVSYEEAVSATRDLARILAPDPQGNLSRYMCIGRTREGRILQVIFRMPDQYADPQTIYDFRLITAFDANEAWRRRYEQHAG